MTPDQGECGFTVESFSLELHLLSPELREAAKEKGIFHLFFFLHKARLPLAYFFQSCSRLTSTKICHRFLLAWH